MWSGIAGGFKYKRNYPQSVKLFSCIVSAGIGVHMKSPKPKKNPHTNKNTGSVKCLARSHRCPLVAKQTVI